MARRETHISLQLGGDQFAFTRVERAHINAISLGIGGTASIREVEEMFAVGQEEGPAIGLNAALAHYPSDGSGSAAARRNPVQGPPKGGPEHNRAIAIPGTSPAKGRIAKNLRRIAGDVHCLKPCVSKESDLAAIGRPEWKARSLSSVDLLRSRSRKGAYPTRLFFRNIAGIPEKAAFFCLLSMLLRNLGEKSGLVGAGRVPGFTINRPNGFQLLLRQ